MRFVIDEQLPPALAPFLKTRGHDARHVRELGLAGKGDASIWAHALANTAVIVTKDEDFVARRTLDPDGPPVLWLRIGNTRTKVLVELIDRLLDQLVEKLESGDRMIQLVRAHATEHG
jgi:predicted nuclease of predicted toxin-antitoxin system